MKSSGMIPMTVMFAGPRRTTCPMTAGSPLNRDRQA